MAKVLLHPGGRRDRESGCLLCGAPLVYSREARDMTCALCGRRFSSPCACREEHYVCDECHTAGLDSGFLPLLLRSGERDPLALLEAVFALPQVHLHGPEHHAAVPCVLLTAYRNCGGELDLPAALRTALQRGKQVTGGACGYWGACGAAIGAGIYLSILTGSTPLNGEAWALPQTLTARCLAAIAAPGGPRCCKRTSRMAVTEAARLTAERFGVEMPLSAPVCRYREKNRECIGTRCPYFGA